MQMYREYCKRKKQEEIEAEKEANLPVKRLYATERDLFMEMAMIRRLTEEIAVDFKNRLELSGTLESIQQTHEAVEKAYNRIWWTIPEDQRKTLKHNIDNAILAIGVKRPGEQGERVGDTDYGVYVTYEDMRIMLDAVRDHCLVCMGSAQDQAGCDLRKVFDRLGVNVEHVDGECGYRNMI